jgi:hypothetical protein
MTSGKVRDHSDFFISHTVLVHGILLTTLVMLLVIGAPKLKEVYKSSYMGLPSPTIYVITASDVASAYVILTVLALIAIMVADAVFSWYLGRNARPIWSLIWGVGISCLLLVIIFFGILFLVIPFYSGISGMGATA